MVHSFNGAKGQYKNSKRKRIFSIMNYICKNFKKRAFLLVPIEKVVGIRNINVKIIRKSIARTRKPL